MVADPCAAHPKPVSNFRYAEKLIGQIEILEPLVAESPRTRACHYSDWHTSLHPRSHLESTVMDMFTYVGLLRFSEGCLNARPTALDMAIGKLEPCAFV